MNKLILSFLGGLLLGSASLVVAQNIQDLQQQFFQSYGTCGGAICLNMQGNANGVALPTAITGTPTVSVTNTPSVSITNTPTVTISGTPTVSASITGTPAVTLNGSPSVTATISGTPAVSISGTPTMTVSGFSFLNVTTNTTSAIKTGSGTFHGIAVNGLGTASTATVYDCNNCTSNKIGTLNTALSLVSQIQDATFTNGLTVVTAGVAASDITVLYK